MYDYLGIGAIECVQSVRLSAHARIKYSSVITWSVLTSIQYSL